MNFKTLLHCAIFRATCLATPLCNKLRESLPNVTYLATAKNVARLVAETVAESTIKFYFPQRLQRIFSALCSVTSVVQLVSQQFATPANENVPLTSCDHGNETSCMKDG